MWHASQLRQMYPRKACRVLPQPDVDGMSMIEDLIPIDLELRIN